MIATCLALGRADIRMAFAALVSSFGRSIRRHSGRKRGVGSLGIIHSTIGAPQAGGSRLRPSNAGWITRKTGKIQQITPHSRPRR